MIFLKKAFAVCMACGLLLGLTGCVTTVPLDKERLPQTPQKDTPQVELTVEVKEKDGEPVLQVLWKNNAEVSVLYGEPYDIQHQRDGQWVSCAVTDPVFLTIGYMLQPGQSRWEQYSPGTIFDMTRPGNYRFVASCQLQKQEREDLQLFAEFTLPAELVSPILPELESPPGLVITDDVTSWEVSPSGYSWTCEQEDGTAVHTIADAVHPLYCQDTMEKLQVSGTKGYLVFPQKPDKISVHCWPDTAWERSDVPEEAVAVTNMVFEWKSGAYIYEVVATWGEAGRSGYGEAHYYFFGIKGEQR